MGKDRPIFDANSDNRRRAFKFFSANFRDFCIMEDYVDPAKAVDSNDYWIATKRPKVMAALRRAFPPAEWDVLTTTIDAQIPDDDKQHPALPWRRAYHSKYSQFSTYSETRTWYVNTRLAHNGQVGISEM